MPVSLNLMMAQRLIGRLCDNCKKAEEAPAPLAKVIEESLQGVGAEIAGKYKNPYLIYHAPGCEKCRNKGVIGRIGVFEVLQMSPGLEDVIAAGPTVQKIDKEAKAQGMIAMREDGVVKALEGLVSLEEVVRITSED